VIPSTRMNLQAASLRDRADAPVDPALGAKRFGAAVVSNVPVESGSICVYHVPAVGRAARRPVVFVSGWGTTPDSFPSFYSAMAPDTEVFHVETREKGSSVLNRKTASFSMDQFAVDISAAVEYFTLQSRDPVLVGTCFGSAVIIHGLSQGLINVDSVICYDPMARLWVPRWVIRIIGSTFPPSVLMALRPTFRRIVLAGMKEPVQRARSAAIIDNAEMWKWRRAALALMDWNLFDVAESVSQRVHVVNGSHDRFHDSTLFPDVAAALPEGVFVRIPVDESHREQLMGIVTSEFAAHEDTSTPPAINAFVAK